MSDVNCPYCDHPEEINHDDGYGYAESETHNQECSKCEKTFVYATFISFHYEAEKADCLNDGQKELTQSATRKCDVASVKKSAIPLTGSGK